MNVDFRPRFVSAVLLFVATTAAPPFFGIVRAEEVKDQLTDTRGKSVAVQQAVAKERRRGPVLISIPVAYTFGLGTDRSPLYCSPSVRAANASNAVIEELIVGITYQTVSGQPAGSSVSRFTNIKVKRLESHFFNQLESTKCTGLEAVLTVVRCVYSSGVDCSPDVQAVGFGAIPVRLRSQ